MPKINVHIPKTPNGKTILDQLEEMGINIPYSCRDGFCSQCTCKKTDGLVAHKKSAIRVPGHDILPCSAKAGEGGVSLQIDGRYVPSNLKGQMAKSLGLDVVVKSTTKGSILISIKDDEDINGVSGVCNKLTAKGIRESAQRLIETLPKYVELNSIDKPLVLDKLQKEIVLVALKEVNLFSANKYEPIQALGAS